MREALLSRYGLLAIALLVVLPVGIQVARLGTRGEQLRTDVDLLRRRWDELALERERTRRLYLEQEGVLRSLVERLEGLESSLPSANDASGGSSLSALITDLASELEDVRSDLAELRETVRQLAASGAPPPIAASFPPVSNPAYQTQEGSNPGKLHWSADQVLGEPDTHAAGDHPTAWASRDPDAGAEWVEVEFGSQVEATGAVIHETYNPGAVVMVEVIAPGGDYDVVWEGHDPTSESPGKLELVFGGLVRAVGLRVHLDTSRVAGWNEIDAIGLLSGDETHWAVSASASSSYSERYPGAASAN